MEKTGKKPNIIMILADDQGPWAMHCAGTPELYTPNLDRIAEQGMRFDSFFCASPVCSPARASILTGKMPSAHGVQDWLRSGNLDGEKFAAQGKENPYFEGYKQERKPISYLEGQPTYTDILAQNGYHCALSGKWHLGNSIEPQQGFQEWYTIGMGGCCYYHPDMVDHGEITVHHGEYVTDLITDRALEYLKELGEGDDPFYLSVHYTAPHSPWEKEHHPAKWIDYYDGCTFPSIPNVPDHPDLRTGAVYGTGKREENLRGYFAAISAMDEQIGRLLDAVEEQGLADNTVILFTADNGMSMGQHGVWGKGNGTFPMNMYDSAVKVPFLISWPGHIPANTVCSEMISACDLLPTILKLTGLSDKQPTGLPGRSFTELLKTAGCGQFSVNISKPGITKGQHWHNSKWEFFIVVSGHGLIQERKVGCDEVMEFEVWGDKPTAVQMLPGCTHNIINLSDTENLVTLMWANEPFDPAKPDTFFLKV